MRRSVVVAAISVVALTLATGASAAPKSVSPTASAGQGGSGTVAPSKVKAGSEWTLELTGSGCESDSFAAHHAFTAVNSTDGDQGTYTGKKTKTLTMTWTAGTASGEVFKGRWRRSTGDYTGTDVQAEVSVDATLVPIAVGGCATVATTPGSSSIVRGSTESDTATVTGEGGITPGGDVHFYVCPGDAAPCTPSSFGAVDLGSSSLAGSGGIAIALSAAFSPSAPGIYCFDGVYLGDGHYGSESDGSTTDECFTVVPSSPTVTTSPTQASIVLGESDSNTATVTGVGGVTPGGDVHFYVCPGHAASCTPNSSGGVVDLGSSLLAGSGGTATARSAAYTPPATGSYCFLAVYGGDNNYASASDGSTADECFNVTSGVSGVPSLGVVALNEVGPHEVLSGGTGQFVVSGPIFLNTSVSSQPWSGSSASVTGTVSVGTAFGIDITAGSNDTVDLVVDGTPDTLTIPAGNYNGSTFLSAVQSAIGYDLNAAYNYAGDLVLSTHDGTDTVSDLQVTGGDALSTLGLSVMAAPAPGNVFDDAIDARADSTLDVYGTIDTTDGTVNGESLWPLDTCFEPEGAIASGNAQTLSSGNPPGVQMSCAGPNWSTSVDYNAIDNHFPQESDPLQGTGAPPNPVTSLSTDNCPGMSVQMNPTEVISGSVTVLTPGVYTTPVDLTGNAVFEDCSGYSDTPANNGQSEGAYAGIYVFEDGLAIDPAAGDSVTGSNVVLATQSPYPLPGNVPGSATTGAFTASGAGNGAPCLPPTTRTDLQSGGGTAAAETVQPGSGVSPCGGTSPAEYGVVAYRDSSLSPDNSETGTGTNFSALVGGKGTVNLTGPTTGVYGGNGTDGIVFYQDPNTPANYGFDAEAGDSADITLNGVVYNASLPNYGVGGPLDYWDGVGGGVVFYQGGTLQTGFGTNWSDGPAESSGSVIINGPAVVDDFNTDGTTNMTIASGTYSPPGAQSSAAHRTTKPRRHRRSKATRRSLHFWNPTGVN
jgi:hypothetical protein